MTLDLEALIRERDAWRLLARARGAMLGTPDATATPAVRERLHEAYDALELLGIDRTATRLDPEAP